MLLVVTISLNNTTPNVRLPERFNPNCIYKKLLPQLFCILDASHWSIFISRFISSRNLKEWNLHPWYWYVWWRFWFYIQVSFHIAKYSIKRFVYYWHFCIKSSLHLLWKKKQCLDLNAVTNYEKSSPMTKYCIWKVSIISMLCIRKQCF